MNYNNLTKKAHDMAVAHGWWDERKSNEHYLMLIISEVGELLNADRADKHADIVTFSMCESTHGFDENFKHSIKDTVQDEFADIAIRLFDFAGALGIDFDRMNPCRYHRAFDKFSFSENALALCKGLTRDMIGVEKRVQFGLEYVTKWAESVGVDIDWHIEKKMEYNQNRPIKHGKKY